MRDYEKKLEAAKRASTSHLLMKCARLVNELALASLPTAPGVRPRPAHMALFPHIDLDHGARVTELATKLGITKQAVAQLVDDLEGFGVVERIPDPEDGRAKRVRFTERGRSSLLDGLAHLRAIDKQLVRALGRDAVQSLHEILLSLQDHLEPRS